MTYDSSPLKTAIIILAAGESKRMGSPKQLLKWGSSTLLNHSIAEAVNSTANAVFVVLGANFNPIKDSIQHKSVTVLNNEEWEKGLGNSITFSIKSIQKSDYDGVLLMLADQPQVDTILLNQLIEDFQKGQQPIIATGYKDGTGVPALFDKSYFKKLTNLSGEKGAKLLIENNTSKTVILQTPNPIIDIDTMGGYEKLYQQYFNAV